MVGHRIHTEDVNKAKPFKARVLGRLGRHVHHPIRCTWSLEIDGWLNDPYALYHCACGATRHMFGGHWTGGSPA